MAADDAPIPMLKELDSIGIWTPAARIVGRVQRVAQEDPGSMQEFHAVLLAAEVMLKLHSAAVLTVLEGFERVSYSRYSYDLSRSSGLGAWGQSLRDALSALQPLLGARQDKSVDWVLTLRNWLSQRGKRPDRDAIADVADPIERLCANLLGEELPARSDRSVLDLMNRLVEIRNKTTAHHAYDRDFWERHVATVLTATHWIAVNSPLWNADLVLPVRTPAGTNGRLLRGVEPDAVIPLPATYGELDGDQRQRPQLLVAGVHIGAVTPLLHVGSADNHTFLFNGSWRDSDSTAEFLCHAIAATNPGQGTSRLELPDFVVRPAELPPSETEGFDRLVADKGIALNNLPPAPHGYVRRGALEERLRAVAADNGRRHVVNVRGIGGIGKTSLVLQICHEIVQSRECPYDAVIWISARDIDLTLRGAIPVRRESESLANVWTRFSRLFEEPETTSQKQYFEDALTNGRYLVILDNFETFDDQAVAYQYLDDLVRPPSKVIITSRHVFTGDYAVVVTGMEFDEARQLLIQAARDAGSEPAMTTEVVERIYSRSQGHPYAMKLIATQLRSAGGVGPKLDAILRQEDLLEALFRRSIEELTDDDHAVYIFLLIAQFARGIPEVALRVAADPHGIDVEQAITQLMLRSVIETDRSASHPRFTMPAMAREFAQRKLIVGHVLQTQVLADAQFLRRYPALIQGSTGEAGEQLGAAAQESRTGAQDEQRSLLAALHSLAEADGKVWPYFARAARALRAPVDVWEGAYKRAVEESPERADLLWEWSNVSHSVDRRIELKVQAVHADPSDLALASRVAMLLNTLYANERGRFPQVKWVALMRPVIEALESRLDALDGEALSRLAWLYIHAGRAEAKAKRTVELAIRVEPDHPSIRKLAARLGVEGR